SEKQQAFKTITDRVGDASGVVNLIEIASDTGGKLNTNVGGAPGAGMTSSSSAGRTHTVKKGETLSHLAQQYYGKASEYNRIFEANRDQLNDPDKIREGMTLQIP
ncbi:MAG TPA: LysM peptidoglycan-binding domain-containing protein, partial [Thermoanaerobaculia bacterium]|nr:LysM peptidoglycan-binding domain-containing protein [Thermoanaerobaculia bacterium]